MEKKKNPPLAKDCAHSFLLGYKKEHCAYFQKVAQELMKNAWY